ncbi:MAG: MutS-related protein [Streptosporangiaceae bacterium]
MMQAGMFVAAESFTASVSTGVFTHFKREEDASMEKGKLDEELSRMSVIADAITGGCLLLCNESFASTNEREGSEIARQIIRALLESGVRVFFVTHMFDLARSFHGANADSVLCLRAERRDDGKRTFRLLEGEPLPTSYGPDLYAQIFGCPAAPPAGGSVNTTEPGRWWKDRGTRSAMTAVIPRFSWTGYPGVSAAEGLAARAPAADAGLANAAPPPTVPARRIS